MAFDNFRFFHGLEANLPPATIDRLAEPAYTTDTNKFFICDGSNWNQVTGGSSFTPPTGTGLMHVTSGAMDGTAYSLQASDIPSLLASYDAAGAAATVQGNLNTHTGLTTAAHGGIVASTDSRLTDSRPASDVYTWAKAATKPTYTYSEVGADAAGAAAAITLSGLGGVPSTRKITSSIDLSADRNLTYSDVGADASGAAATVAGNLTTHANLTTAHGSTNLNTASTIVQRDGSGGFVAGPINITGVTGAGVPAFSVSATAAGVATDIIQGVSATGAVERFSFTMDETVSFLGVTDPVARFGYNIGAGGNPHTAGEPAIWFAFESNYAVSAGQRQLEYYCQVLPSAHTGFRPFMATYNETTDAATFIIYSDSFSIYSRDGLTAKCLVPITGYAMQFQSDVLIQNTASLKFLATGDASPRYVLGFSGDGSFNFQSTDTVTPRSFYITSSGGSAKASIGFETGAATFNGNLKGASLEAAGNVILDSAGTRIVSTSGTGLTLTQTGDAYGASSLKLLCRSGSAGALYSCASLDLFDMGFVGSGAVQNNLRMEHRSGSLINSGNTGGEFQFLPAATSTVWFATGPAATVVKSGSLGVGAASPGANLDVQRVGGDSLDIVRIGSNGGYYFGFARSNTTGALSVQGNQAGYNNIILCPTSGSVGIAMAPTYTLDVTGNFRCSTGFSCNGKTPQTAYASGGAAGGTATSGGYGFVICR